MMYYNSFLSKLICKIEKQQVKKVKFKNNVKKFDGSSKSLTVYCQILEGFYDNKINNINDILKITDNIDYINFCIKELNIVKDKLLYLKNNKDKIDNKIYLDEKYLLNKEFDEYWDNDSFINRIRNINIKGPAIPLVRFGSRDCQYCVFLHDLVFVEKMINNLEIIRLYFIFN